LNPREIIDPNIEGLAKTRISALKTGGSLGTMSSDMTIARSEELETPTL
jgi:hypothetical protein